MPRHRIVLALAVLASGCSAMQICPQRTATVRQTAMSCGELNQVAAAAVRRMGYTIETFAPASAESPGKITGKRHDYYDSRFDITVDLACSTAEAVATAVSTVGCAGQINFPNEFQASFQASTVKKVGPSMLTEEERTGLRIVLEPLRDGDSALGVPLAAADLMPVKVTIHNRTGREYRLDDDSVSMTTQDGKRVAPLTAAEAAKRVAEAKPGQATAAAAELAAKALGTGVLEANETREGYLYVPRQAYKRATVRLVDLEADEPEGFAIEL